MTKINTENICKIKITGIFDEVQVIDYISKIQIQTSIINERFNCDMFVVFIDKTSVCVWGASWSLSLSLSLSVNKKV